MFKQYLHPAPSINEEITVCGIPFTVTRNEYGAVKKIPLETQLLPSSGEAHLNFSAACDVLFFLGMATDSVYCSEWWAQQETMHDHSVRIFFGDRLMRIRVIFEDNTEELISVIFGVNAWNYNLYYGAHENEHIMCWDAPYNEPFASDPEAKAMKDACLKLMENTDSNAEKCTKWIFAYRINSGKAIKEIVLVKEESKQAGIAVSAVTGLLSGGYKDPSWICVDQDFFLGRKYYAELDKMARRLYQYKDELPKSDSKKEIDNFDAPDITFKGAPMADIYTNVYRFNIIDMAHGKIEDDGRSHTSTPFTCNFGCYLGFGTFKEGCDSYGGHVWTRDIGRTLMELVNTGYDKKVIPAADYLHKLLYYKSYRFPIPHWKRVANIEPDNEKDIWLDGNENDGHAAVMLFIYSMYRKGITDISWLRAHAKELKDASDYYLWQKNNPDKSNFSDMLYSMSEASTQLTGGYDLFSNIISSYALTAYSRLFNALGEQSYAACLSDTAQSIRAAAIRHFTMKHPRYGDVLTDTTDDCWTYEYKRMVDLLIYSDMYGYDMAKYSPEFFDLMTRTFLAQKESFYAPESGRQMGYGQGYLTQSAIMLDLYDEMTECIETAAMFCYHHHDHNYIVPEGVIVHASKGFWFRNSDLGNAVQQAEIVKCARLLIGIDDILPERGLRLIPRLPLKWSGLEAADFPVACKDGVCRPFTFTYERGNREGKTTASDGTNTFTADWSGDRDVEYVRMGPFTNENITVTNGNILEIMKIQNNYFAYVEVK